MHKRLGHRSMCCALLAIAASCQDNGGTNSDLAFIATAGFHGYVTADTLQQFVSPEGPVSQYEIRMHKAPPDTGDAGVFINSAGTVYVRAGGDLTLIAAATVAAGDSLWVWTDGSVGHGQDGFPVTTPIYFARQLVVAHPQ